MAELLKKRIEQIKSRRAAEDTLCPQPDSANGIPLATAKSSTIATVDAKGMTNNTGVPAFPLSSSSSTGSARVPSNSSIPLANLPPSFTSPHNAVVKYRDAARDPLCATFTTRNVVSLLDAALRCAKRKRERETDTDRNKYRNDKDHEQCDNEKENEEEEEENNEERRKEEEEEEAGGSTEDTFPCIESSLATVVSYFLPDLTEKSLAFGEKETEERKRKESEGVHYETHGTLVVSGKPRVPCRSVNEYVPISRLAQGVYGVVFSATESASNNQKNNSYEPQQAQSRKYALKHIKKQWLAESQVGFPPYLLREFDLLLRMRHPNVVQAREVVLLDKKLEATRQKQTRDNLLKVTGTEHAADKEDEDEPNIANSTDVRTMNRPVEKDTMKDVYLVMEYCPYDLKSFMYLHDTRGVYLHLSSRNVHPDAHSSFLSRVKCIMQQLFRGLAFLHDHRILHRDIKTSNILVSSQGVVKLCDFGLGRLYREGQELTANVVTLMYRAPELHFGVRDYSHKMDVWSLGCIMAELFLKMPLFRAEEETKHFAAICEVIGIPTEETFSGLYKMPAVARIMRAVGRYNRENHLRQVFAKSRHAGAAAMPESGFDLLERILRWNPADRLSASEALRHPFFSEAPLPCEPGALLLPIPSLDAAPSQAQRTSATMATTTTIATTTTTTTKTTTTTETGATATTTTALETETATGTPTCHDGEETEENNEKSDPTNSDSVDTERALLRELESLKDVQSPREGEEARRVAEQARMRANRDFDSGSSPDG